MISESAFYHTSMHHLCLFVSIQYTDNEYQQCAGNCVALYHLANATQETRKGGKRAWEGGKGEGKGGEESAKELQRSLLFLFSFCLCEARLFTFHEPFWRGSPLSKLLTETVPLKRSSKTKKSKSGKAIYQNVIWPSSCVCEWERGVQCERGRAKWTIWFYVRVCVWFVSGLWIVVISSRSLSSCLVAKSTSFSCENCWVQQSRYLVTIGQVGAGETSSLHQRLLDDDYEDYRTMNESEEPMISSV